MTNPVLLPSGPVSKLPTTSSPTANVRAAATAPTHGLPETRQPTTASSSTASRHMAGGASRKNTCGVSTPLIWLAVAIWANANQWYVSGSPATCGSRGGKWCFASPVTDSRKSWSMKYRLGLPLG